MKPKQPISALTTGQAPGDSHPTSLLISYPEPSLPSLAERRAAQLRMSVDPKDTEESEFLEDYLKWVTEGGPSKLDEQMATNRRKAARAEYERYNSRKP